MVGYRVAGYRTPVRGEPSREAGRFHTEFSPPTQYLSLHPLGPTAEILRHGGFDQPAQVRELRLRIWALRITVPDNMPAVDYHNSAAVLDLSATELVSDDYRATQRAADRLRAAQSPGFFFPSAALPGTRNLVLFGERVAISYEDAAVGAWEVPASIVADRGAPPASLISLVRYFGTPHAGLERHELGEVFRFVEPSWRMDASGVRE